MVRTTTTRSPWTVLVSTSLAVFAVFLDTTILFVAFPAITPTSAASAPSTLSWVLNAYTIVFAALLIPAGRLADRVGRRRTFLIGGRRVHRRLDAVRPRPDASGARSPPVCCRPSAPLRSCRRRSPSCCRPSPATRSRSPSRSGGPSAPSPVPSAPRSARSSSRTSVGGGRSSSTCRSASSASRSGGACCRRGGRRTRVACPIRSASSCSPRARARRRSPSSRPTSGDGSARRFVATVAVSAVAASPCSSGDAAGCRTRCSTCRSSTRSRSDGPTPAMLVYASGFSAMFLGNVLFLTEVWHYSILRAGLAISVGPLIVAVTAPFFGRLAGRVGQRALLVPGGLVWASGGVCSCSRATDREPATSASTCRRSSSPHSESSLVLPQLSSAAVQGLPADRFGSGSAVNQAVRNLGATLGVALVVAFTADVDTRDGALVLPPGVVVPRRVRTRRDGAGNPASSPHHCRQARGARRAGRGMSALDALTTFDRTTAVTIDDHDPLVATRRSTRPGRHCAASTAATSPRSRYGRRRPSSSIVRFDPSPSASCGRQWPGPLGSRSLPCVRGATSPLSR